MVDFQQELNLITRRIGSMFHGEPEGYTLPTHLQSKRPFIAFELTDDGHEIRSLIERFTLAMITEYSEIKVPHHTMTVRYTDQPIFDELVGDLWDKAYKQGIEDERTSASLELGIQANRDNPYRSK